MSKRSERSIQISGDTMIALRESWGMTQAAFAKALGGMSREWAARAERQGTGPVSKKVFEAIAQVCGLGTTEVIEMLKQHDAMLLMATLVEDGRRKDDAFAHTFDDAPLPRPKPTIALDDGGLRPIAFRRVPVFNVKIPAGKRWIDSDPRQHQDADGETIVDASVPADAFALRIHGDCMEPDFPSGSLIVFAPVSGGDGGMDFDAGKPHYFEHTDGRSTFKLVYFDADQSRWRLQPINPKYDPIYVPEQMMARLNRAIKLVRDLM